LLEADTRIFDDFWHLDWDEFAVICDTHSPNYNAKMFDRLLQVCEKYKINHIVHAGDFFDGESFSYWPGLTEDPASFAAEIKASKKIVNTLLGHFPEIHFFMGTHDLRFWRMLSSQGKKETFTTPFDLLESEKIKVSRYHYCDINGEWRITHPKNTVKVGGLPAIRMSAKFMRSVVFAHGHWMGMVRDPSGKHWLCAPGCMVDPRRIAYKNLMDTSHDEWVPGFMIVVEKVKPILFAEDSPWEVYGIKV
jgi:hypothetical protein